MTINPSPSMDRQYRDFNCVFQYKAGTYAIGTRYLRAGARYKVPGGEMFGTNLVPIYLVLSTYVNLHLSYKWFQSRGGGSLGALAVNAFTSL